MAHSLSTSAQLGHILMTARRRKKLTQTQVAALTGIAQSRLSKLEADPSTMTVAQLLSLTAAYELRLAVDDSTPATHAAPEW